MKIVPLDAVTSQRLPLATGPEAEAALAGANRRSHDHAVALMDRWVPGFDWETRSQTVDSSTLMIGEVAPGFLDRIDANAVLDRYLSVADLGLAGLKMFRDGEAVPPEAFLQVASDSPISRAKARPGLVAELLHVGYTAVMDGLELSSRPLMQLTEIVERVFGSACNVNGYLSLRRHTSFGAHWDDQEVVIVQMVGRKDWEIFEPAALSMHRRTHGAAVTSKSVWAGTLSPGQVLYVPRGWGHRVTGRDELTFHLTMTIPRFNGLAVIDSTIDSAQGLDEPIRLVEVDSLIERTIHALDGAAPRSALAAMRGRIPSRSTQRYSDLEQAFSNRTECLARSVNPGGMVLGSSGESSNVIVSHGVAFHADPDLCQLVGRIADGRARRLDSLDPGWDDARELCLLGLLDVLGPRDLIWDEPLEPSAL